MIGRHPQAALIPYLRGELDGERRARIADHLQACASCRADADQAAAAMRELARRVEDIAAPDRAIYRAQLHRKLEARARRAAPVAAAGWPRRRAIGFSVAGLGAVAAALAVALVMRPARVASPPLDQLAAQAGAIGEAAMSGADVGLLRDYPVVEHLEMLENYDVIAHLDEVSPSAPASDENRS